MSLGCVANLNVGERVKDAQHVEPHGCDGYYVRRTQLYKLNQLDSPTDHVKNSEVLVGSPLAVTTGDGDRLAFFNVKAPRSSNSSPISRCNNNMCC